MEIIKEGEPYFKLKDKINDLDEFALLNDSIIEKISEYKSKSPAL